MYFMEIKTVDFLRCNSVKYILRQDISCLKLREEWITGDAVRSNNDNLSQNDFSCEKLVHWL